MSLAQPACRALLAVVFAVAVVGKARSRTAFALFVGSLADHRWLPARLRGAAAVSTLAAETAVVVLMVPAGRPGALLALGLLAAFTGVTLRAGRAGDCQCFGTGAAGSGPGAFVARNVTLALAAVAVVLLPGGPVASGPGAVAVLSGAVAGLAVTRWDDLAYLLRRPATG